MAKIYRLEVAGRGLNGCERVFACNLGISIIIQKLRRDRTVERRCSHSTVDKRKEWLQTVTWRRASVSKPSSWLTKAGRNLAPAVQTNDLRNKEEFWVDS